MGAHSYHLLEVLAGVLGKKKKKSHQIRKEEVKL